jgi:hypothetical protein
MRNLSLGMAVAATLLLAAGAAEAKTCKPAAVSAANTQASVVATAQGAAVQAWTVKVFQQFGKDWQDYSIADGAAESCAPSGAGFICTASAKPCKP